MQDDCVSPFLLTVTTSSFHRCDFIRSKGSCTNYVIADGGGGVSPNDYSITQGAPNGENHENEITQRFFHFSWSRANVRLMLVFILLITMTLLTC